MSSDSEQRFLNNVVLFLNREIFHFTRRIQRCEEGSTPIGSLGIEYQWSADVLMELKQQILKGASLAKAEEEAKSTAHKYIKTHNSRRPKDVNWQRWIGCVDHVIDNVLKHFGKVPTICPPSL